MRSPAAAWWRAASPGCATSALHAREEARSASPRCPATTSASSGCRKASNPSSSRSSPVWTSSSAPESCAASRGRPSTARSWSADRGSGASVRSRAASASSRLSVGWPETDSSSTSRGLPPERAATRSAIAGARSGRRRRTRMTASRSSSGSSSSRSKPASTRVATSDLSQGRSCEPSRRRTSCRRGTESSRVSARRPSGGRRGGGSHPEAIRSVPVRRTLDRRPSAHGRARGAAADTASTPAWPAHPPRRNHARRRRRQLARARSCRHPLRRRRRRACPGRRAPGSCCSSACRPTSTSSIVGRAKTWRNSSTMRAGRRPHSVGAMSKPASR